MLYNRGDWFMNQEYIDDEDLVYFRIESNFGINNEIILPLSLVEDLKEHINAFDAVLKYPLNSVIFNALSVYMDYINAELVSFESVKPHMERCMELDMQEMMVESNE